MRGFFLFYFRNLLQIVQVTGIGLLCIFQYSSAANIVAISIKKVKFGGLLTLRCASVFRIQRKHEGIHFYSRLAIGVKI